MPWLYAFLVTAPLNLLAWGLMDRDVRPRSVKTFLDWWSRDGMMVFIVIFMFALLWFGRHEPPDHDAMPEYP